MQKELNDLADTIHIALEKLSKYEAAQNARFLVLLPTVIHCTLFSRHNSCRKCFSFSQYMAHGCRSAP